MTAEQAAQLIDQQRQLLALPALLSGCTRYGLDGWNCIMSGVLCGWPW